MEMQRLIDWLDTLLSEGGVNGDWVPLLRLFILLAAVATIGALLFLGTRQFIIHYLYRLFRRSPISWDDLLADHGTFNRFAHLLPAIFLRLAIPHVLADFPAALPWGIRIADVALILAATSIIRSFLRLGEFTLAAQPAFKDKPLTSYFQVVNILLYLLALILSLSVLLDRSPVYFLSAFGAMTAILLLVFKDTILGLVASVQISSNDMVRVGDWVEMPKFNADGDVIAINLHTVKVQNWDKTITSIPTYAFITDSFRNWRGMVQSGGRRIKRALYIDVHSVRFVDAGMTERFRKFHLVADHMDSRQREIDAFNRQHHFDTSVLINGRRMTNLGVFRTYVERYLRNHPMIRQDMTILVRQLATESRGIPLEIYCFTGTTEWSAYESIQSDIFDHLFAAATSFDLELFQEPSGADISSAARQVLRPHAISGEQTDLST